MYSNHENENRDVLQNMNLERTEISTLAHQPPTRQSLSITTQSPPICPIMSQIYWYFYPLSDNGLEIGEPSIIAVNHPDSHYLPMHDLTTQYCQVGPICPYHESHNPIPPQSLQLVSSHEPEIYEQISVPAPEEEVLPDEDILPEEEALPEEDILPEMDLDPEFEPVPELIEGPFPDEELDPNPEVEPQQEPEPHPHPQPEIEQAPDVEQNNSAQVQGQEVVEMEHYNDVNNSRSPFVPVVQTSFVTIPIVEIAGQKFFLVPVTNDP